MNQYKQAPTPPPHPYRWRRAVWIGSLSLSLYIVSYMLDSLLGGYWAAPERDGHDRYRFGALMPTACLWQPRFGYWTPYRSD